MGELRKELGSELDAEPGSESESGPESEPESEPKPAPKPAPASEFRALATTSLVRRAVPLGGFRLTMGCGGKGSSGRAALADLLVCISELARCTKEESGYGVVEVGQERQKSGTIRRKWVIE